jgi:hypothetical protein
MEPTKVVEPAVDVGVVVVSVVRVVVVTVVVVALGGAQVDPVILDCIQVRTVETRAYTPVHKQGH